MICAMLICLEQHAFVGRRPCPSERALVPVAIQCALLLLSLTFCRLWCPHATAVGMHRIRISITAITAITSMFMIIMIIVSAIIIIIMIISSSLSSSSSHPCHVVTHSTILLPFLLPVSGSVTLPVLCLVFLVFLVFLLPLPMPLPLLPAHLSSSLPALPCLSPIALLPLLLPLPLPLALTLTVARAQTAALARAPLRMLCATVPQGEPVHEEVRRGLDGEFDGEVAAAAGEEVRAEDVHGAQVAVAPRVVQAEPGRRLPHNLVLWW